MKIKLHFIHPNNYGNLMMASVFIQNFFEIAKIKDNIEFYVDIHNQTELKRISDSLNCNAIIKEERVNFERIEGNSKILRRLKNINTKYKEIRYNADKYDVHIYLGGDCLSEYYSKIGFILDAISIKMISKYKPVYLVGQTLGPFTSYRKYIANKCLKNTYIYTRDDMCFKYLKNSIGLNKIIKSRDLAFLDIPYQNDKKIVNDTLAKYAFNCEYITVVASGLYNSYVKNINDYIYEYVNIIKYIIDDKKYNVLLLAHVIHNSNSNDKYIIDKIMDKIDEKYKNKIKVVDNLILPYEARIIIGNGKLTITGRMHAAVSSLNMGVPPISLSYSVKYRGVIGDGFEFGDYIIECKDSGLWENGQVSQNTIKSINIILENYDVIISQITHKLKQVQQMSINQIKDINNKLIGGKDA